MVEQEKKENHVVKWNFSVVSFDTQHFPLSLAGDSGTIKNH